MSTHSTRLAHLEQYRARPAAWTRVRHTVAAMIRARQTRRLLAQMDDRTLADIGLGRGDAMYEAARPMWDLDHPV